MMHGAVSVGVSGQPGFGNRCCQRAAFFGVILSDERSEESKDPYTSHSLSPGMIFVGARSRRNPLARGNPQRGKRSHCDFLAAIGPLRLAAKAAARSG